MHREEHVTRIPYYFEQLDWPSFVTEYPPPARYAETHGRLSDEELRALQNQRFLARVAEAWQAPFYRKRWSAVGLEPGDIRDLDDITKIPMFTSDDLKKSIEDNPPFGEHYRELPPDAEPVPMKVQTSGGSTGLPRPTLFDVTALEVQAVQMARAFVAQGARPGDRAQITYTNALGNAAWNAYTAMLHWAGVVPVTTGTGLVTPSEKQLEYARVWGVDWWFARGEYLGRLVQVAEEIGFDLHQLKTRFLHSYLGPDLHGDLRNSLQAAWNAPVYDNYGAHEIGLIAFECREQDGKHVNEDTVFLETADVDTGAILTPGEKGSLVATSLHRSTPPIIRYNLRDLLQVHPRQTCGCGLHTARLSMFLGRADEMVKLRGTNVYPVACQTAINRDPRTTGDYICVVEHVGEGTARRERMTVRIEHRDGVVDREALKEDLARALHHDLGVRLEVEIVAPGSLAEVTRLGKDKVRRLLDLRS
jgi:phenylacetate-CoA ligase